MVTSTTIVTTVTMVTIVIVTITTTRTSMMTKAVVLPLLVRLLATDPELPTPFAGRGVSGSWGFGA